MVVIQCFGVDFPCCGVWTPEVWTSRRCGPQRCGPPGGVDLRGVDLPEVWTSLLILHTLIVASVLLHA
jgi:hypothetical protein